MKNVIFIISTLQECDVFFSFAAGLKDKNKRLKIINRIFKAVMSISNFGSNGQQISEA